MNLSVVIVTRNEEERIGDLLDSVHSQTREPDELLVIDGNSSDSTREIAERKRAEVLLERGDNLCPANARNQGVEEASGDVVCLLDGDSYLPDEELFEKAMDVMADGVLAVDVPVEPTADTLFEKVTAVSGNPIQPIFIRREAFRDIGGYPLIGFGEDNILGKKIRDYAEKEGERIHYLEDSGFGGHPVSNFTQLWKQAEWYGRTLVPFIREYKNHLGAVESTEELMLRSLRPAYSLSFLLAAYSLFADSVILTWPFLILFTGTVLNNLKQPVKTLKVATNLIYGYGFIYGLFRYLAGDRHLGRL